MCENEAFFNNFDDFNLDFLNEIPSTENPQPTYYQLYQENDLSKEISDTSLTPKLARRIASTHELVQKIHELTSELHKKTQQIADFKHTAGTVTNLYESEKKERVKLNNRVEELQAECERLDAKLADYTLNNDQLKAQLEKRKGPIEYGELAQKYLKLIHKFDYYALLNSCDHESIRMLNIYCIENKLRVPEIKSPKSPKKNAKPKGGNQELPCGSHQKSKKADQEIQCKLDQKSIIVDQEVQCELLNTITIVAVAPTEPKQTKHQSIQCSKVATVSRGTQHKPMTVTRSTCFPEPVRSPVVNNILKEMLGWSMIKPIEPIPDLKVLDTTTVSRRAIEVKTVGSCTDICNIQREVDFIPNIKLSTSRPPSRLANDVKQEKNTPLSSPMMSTFNEHFSKPINVPPQLRNLKNVGTMAFEELWQVFGNLLLSLIQNQSEWAQNQQKNEARYSNEFFNWLRSVYDSMLQEQQQSHFMAPTKSPEMSYKKPNASMSDKEKEPLPQEMEDMNANSVNSKSSVRESHQQVHMSCSSHRSTESTNSLQIKSSENSAFSPYMSQDMTTSPINCISSLSELDKQIQMSFPSHKNTESTTAYPQIKSSKGSAFSQYMEQDIFVKTSEEETGFSEIDAWLPSIESGIETEQKKELTPIHTEEEEDLTLQTEKELAPIQTKEEQELTPIKNITIGSASVTIHSRRGSVESNCSSVEATETAVDFLLSLDCFAFDAGSNSATPNTVEEPVNIQKRESESVQLCQKTCMTKSSNKSFFYENIDSAITNEKLRILEERLQMIKEVKRDIAESMQSRNLLFSDITENEISAELVKDTTYNTRSRSKLKRSSYGTSSPPIHLRTKRITLESDQSLDSLSEVEDDRVCNVSNQNVCQGNTHVIDVSKTRTSPIDSHKNQSGMHLRNNQESEANSLETARSREQMKNISENLSLDLEISDSSESETDLIIDEEEYRTSPKINEELSLSSKQVQLSEISDGAEEIEMCVNEIKSIDAVVLDCPTQEEPSKTPTKIPLTLNLRPNPQGERILLNFIKSYSTNDYNALHKVINTSQLERDQKLQTMLHAQIHKYLNSSTEIIDLESTELIINLHKITMRMPLIVKAIIAEVQIISNSGVSGPSLESRTPVVKEYWGPLNTRIEVMLRHLHFKTSQYTKEMLAHVDDLLFNSNNIKTLSNNGLVNLTQLYLFVIYYFLPQNQLGPPTRAFLGKCLYFYHKRIPLIVYELLSCFPTTLPPREERSYDRSDAIITVCQHKLMTTNYDMDANDYRQKKFLSMLRFQYHYEPFKPSRPEVLQNLVDKLKAGKLNNLNYAFAIFCKYMPTEVVKNDVLQGNLIPLAREYYQLLHETNEYDERIAALLNCISAVIKPFPVETDVTQYLKIFSQFLYEVKRPVIQESAVQALLRLQRFNIEYCYNALLNFQPHFSLSTKTLSQIKTFIYSQPLQFWKNLELRASLNGGRSNA